MNAPEINELYDNQNHQKVEFEEDSRVPNAGSFKIYLEDHTIGNLIRAQLLENGEVQFAGYKKPHPLVNHIEIKLRTSYQTKPVEALNKALNGLITKVNKVNNDFEKELIETNKRKPFK